jgi:GMP synthase-like glutamine amidotransferase
MKCLILKNNPREGPGLIQTILNREQIAFDLIDLDNHEPIPSLDGYSAVFVMGGPDSANDPTTKMIHELHTVQQILSRGIPYFGVCLGMQVLVKALGGTVLRNSVPEIGCKDPHGNYYALEFTPEGQMDPIFTGLQSPLHIFQLHGETVQLHSTMSLLATGTHCRHQVVQFGSTAYGIQGHFELTSALFHEWRIHMPELQTLNQDALIQDYLQLTPEYESTCTTMIGNFLKLVKK